MSATQIVPPEVAIRKRHKIDLEEIISGLITSGQFAIFAVLTKTI